MTLEPGTAASEIERQMSIGAQQVCDVPLGGRRINDEFLLKLMLEISLC